MTGLELYLLGVTKQLLWVVIIVMVLSAFHVIKVLPLQKLMLFYLVLMTLHLVSRLSENNKQILGFIDHTFNHV